MKLAIFGLTLSSSWGNGHATLWRGLCRELIRRGHHIVFFERDVSYYAENRDLHSLEGGELVLYDEWEKVSDQAREEIAQADATIITSYCPDALAATALVRWSPHLRVFYDLDTPVTLSRLAGREEVGYLGERGLRDFDLALSYTGGEALERLRSELGAARVAPLYGSVDPGTHRPAAANPVYEADLSYLGTYSADRQDALEELFLAPAAARPERTFIIGGAQYPADFSWRENIRFVRHLPPGEHAAFFCSSPLTLNVTRGPMKRLGYCPSGRLFEAAASGTAIITDEWEGLEHFFDPSREIIVARDRCDVLRALARPPAELRQIGEAARRRVLHEHTAAHRARELEALLGAASLIGREPA